MCGRAGDLDPITKQPFEDPPQPGTAPEADALACSSQPQAARQAPSGRGRAAAPNGGNTLANYQGFLSGGRKGAESSAAGFARQPGAAPQQRPAAVPAAAEPPAQSSSPTPAQWEAFNRRRAELRPAAPLARAKLASFALSQQGASQPAADPPSKSGAGDLLARLRAAVRQGTTEDAATSGQDPCQQQQQQQQPISVADLGLPRSPTVDDVLGCTRAPLALEQGGPGPAQPAAAEQVQQQPRWTLQAATAGPDIPWLASPAMPAQRAQAPALEGAPAAPTPGFYAALGSEAHSGERTALAGAPLPTPVQPGTAGGLASEAEQHAPLALHRTFDAALGSPGHTPDGQSPRSRHSPRSSDPMADLSHLPECERAAKEAVDRIFAAAYEDAAQHQLQQLPPPAHLRQQREAAALEDERGASLAAGKRALLAEGGSAGKENSQAPRRYGPPASSVKRHKQLASANPFAAFAFQS